MCRRGDNKKKMLRNKTVHFEHLYNFVLNHFFIEVIFYCLLMKNVIENRKFWIPKRLYEIQEKFSIQNCPSVEDIQIYFRTLFN